MWGLEQRPREALGGPAPADGPAGRVSAVQQPSRVLVDWTTLKTELPVGWGGVDRKKEVDVDAGVGGHDERDEERARAV